MANKTAVLDGTIRHYAGQGVFLELPNGNALSLGALVGTTGWRNKRVRITVKHLPKRKK